MSLKRQQWLPWKTNPIPRVCLSDLISHTSLFHFILQKSCIVCSSHKQDCFLTPDLYLIMFSQTVFTHSPLQLADELILQHSVPGAPFLEISSLGPQSRLGASSQCSLSFCSYCGLSMRTLMNDTSFSLPDPNIKSLKIRPISIFISNSCCWRVQRASFTIPNPKSQQTRPPFMAVMDTNRGRLSNRQLKWRGRIWDPQAKFLLPNSPLAKSLPLLDKVSEGLGQMGYTARAFFTHTRTHQETGGMWKCGPASLSSTTQQNG